MVRSPFAQAVAITSVEHNLGAVFKPVHIGTVASRGRREVSCARIVRWYRTLARKEIISWVKSPQDTGQGAICRHFSLEQTAKTGAYIFMRFHQRPKCVAHVQVVVGSLLLQSLSNAPFTQSTHMHTTLALPPRNAPDLSNPVTWSRTRYIRGIYTEELFLQRTLRILNTMNLHNTVLCVLIAALATVSSSALRARDVVSATIGLGDTSDRKYVVSVTIGDSTVALQLDTGSSDLLVISKACQTAACQNISEAIYDPGSSFKEVIPDTDISDVFLGQPIGHGRIGQETVTIAGLTAKDQYIGVIDKIDNTTVFNGAVGIFGLGFPLASDVELGAAINKVFADPSYDPSLRDIFTVFGPMIPRLALTGAIEQPMFAVTLQRDTIDISGTGQVTIGQLPDGIDNSSITWVPVHLYKNVTNSTTTFPIHWEVPLDAIHIDDKQLPTSNDLLNGSSILPLNALINMGNPYINGSKDVVNALLQTVSPSSSVINPPTFPCDTPHNLTFQIGGKRFPVDPRDFVSQPKPGNATACAATVGSTSRAPTDDALYSWILGAPFLKSNLVVFYYGNLTDPADDPPRIGFLSRVPDNAGQLLKDAVQKAQSAGGNFETTTQAAPTSGGVSTDAPRSSKGNSAGSVHNLCSRLVMPVIALVSGILYAL